MLTVEDLTIDQVKEMSDEEAAFWFSVLQQQEQSRKMKQTLINYIDAKEAAHHARTIKVDSKVIQ